MRGLTIVAVLLVVVLAVTCRANRPAACSEPKKPGPCRAYMPRYYYNSGSARCERFIYGGCGKNGNNFSTKAACESRCG